MRKLLTLSQPKIDKGLGYGYWTAVLHLAPGELSGFQVCRFATAQCLAGCLNTAGHGGIGAGSLSAIASGRKTNTVQQCRIARTKLLFQDREAFFAQLVNEIGAHEERARRASLVPAVRLNGTSDLPWERMPLPASLVDFPANIFQAFPNLQFYDYTKRPNRVNLPSNYHLTFSLAETPESLVHAETELARGRNVAVVFGVARGKPLPASYLGRPVIDGDLHDLRFLDVPGVIVGLRAKGRARRAPHGFVKRDFVTIQSGSSY
jgi:hypothetical protein